MPVKERLKKILELFLCFLKIGAFTFGGGYAMVSLVQRDMVEKKKWLTDREMVDVIAIAESTPGVIALNTATYVGAKIAGFWGSLFASIGAMLPSVIIILAIYPVIQLFGENQYVKWAFLGIRACVAALILNATYKISKMNEKGIIWGIIGRQRKKKKAAAEGKTPNAGDGSAPAEGCVEVKDEARDEANALADSRGDAGSAAKEADGTDDGSPVSERPEEKKEEN